MNTGFDSIKFSERGEKIENSEDERYENHGQPIERNFKDCVCVYQDQGFDLVCLPAGLWTVKIIKVCGIFDMENVLIYDI